MRQFVSRLPVAASSSPASHLSILRAWRRSKAYLAGRRAGDAETAPETVETAPRIASKNARPAAEGAREEEFGVDMHNLKRGGLGPAGFLFSEPDIQQWPPGTGPLLTSTV